MRRSVATERSANKRQIKHEKEIFLIFQTIQLYLESRRNYSNFFQTISYATST